MPQTEAQHPRVMAKTISNSLEGQALGKYQVLKTIGKGNMATVYLGQDPFVDRPVAIKVAADEYVNSSDNGPLYRQMFFNEAQAAGMLKHPNVTAIFDAGVDQDRYYIVMEYVYGGTTLDRFTSSQHLLSIKNLTDILYQCAMALDYAHRKGVIHRDIKPKNILITDDLEAKITDFGVAIVPHLQEGMAPEHAGSPLYMAPEQLRLEEATNQCDLFSLGVVAYELLTGKHPFEGGSEHVGGELRSDSVEAIGGFNARGDAGRAPATNGSPDRGRRGAEDSSFEVPRGVTGGVTEFASHGTTHVRGEGMEETHGARYAQGQTCGKRARSTRKRSGSNKNN